ncbi:MAG: serine/threonine-protein phosphatase [Labilibaculum sp.]|nr:PP2C family serine/threonine-protein phosphatase [Labilibaculum sp.]MBI9056812.1 serine/threonine-protein phosphatase [Labilibaculum sp.]
MRFEFFHYSETGPRPENQDSFEVKNYNDIFVACVADGVGGENFGKLASSLSVEKFIKKVTNSKCDLNNILLSIHNGLQEKQNSDVIYKGMATTFTGCVIEDNILTGVHCGDSRLCILRRNGIQQLSENHTEVNRLLKSGKIRREDIEDYPRKHVLDSAIGIRGIPKIQKIKFKVNSRDRILITSDGVHDVISKVEFRDLSLKSVSINDFGRNVIETLKSKKITDNTTFIIAEII